MSNKESKALVSVEQKVVDFYEDEVMVVLAEDGEIYVPLRPICDFLGVSWSGQYERLQRDAVLSEEIRSIRVTRTQDQTREMISIPLDFLNGWLFGISANRVRDEIRVRLIRYQRECYRILANAFRSEPAHVTPEIATLIQVRNMGLAIAQLAQEQMEFERRVDDKLGQVVEVMGDLTNRVSSLEKGAAPSEYVTDEQASQVSQAVKAIGMKLSERSRRNEYGGVYGELYRQFGITSYKLLPSDRFEEAMKFLTQWHENLVGGSSF